MGLIPEETISQVLERCDIVETISGYIPLKRAGRNFKACCPFHNEKTPSFVVNPQKQIFHCFGCGLGGNVVSFVMRQEHLEFPEAIRMLASQVGITVSTSDRYDHQTKSEREFLFEVNHLARDFFHQNLLMSKDAAADAARGYLKERGLKLETVNALHLGFALDRWDSLLNFLRGKNITVSFIDKAGLISPKEKRDGFYDRFRNRIIFPIFDARARCVAFGARAMADDRTKYINSPETTLYTKGNHLYGLHVAKQAIREKDAVIVVEGYMDFILPFQCGIQNIVASLGTALTVEQIRLLRRYTKNIIMLFDTDKAGESATLRSLDLLIEEGLSVKVAQLSAGDDPDSYVRKNGVDAFTQRIEEAQTLFDYKMKVLMGRYSHKTVEGKEKISTEILPTISRFQNAVVKFSYVKQLADILNVPEQALLVELQKIPKQSQETLKVQLQRPVIQKRLRTIERDLLKLILLEDSYIPKVRESIALSDFEDKQVKNIIAQVFALIDQGKEVTLNNLMTTTNDPEVISEISRLVADDHPVTADKDKMLQDYLNGLKKHRVQKQRRELMEKIRAAEAEGDYAQLDRYLKEYNQSIKKGSSA